MIKPYQGVKYGLFYGFSFPLISSPPPLKLVSYLPFCLVIVNLFKGFARKGFKMPFCRKPVREHREPTREPTPEAAHTPRCFAHHIGTTIPQPM